MEGRGVSDLQDDALLPLLRDEATRRAAFDSLVLLYQRPLYAFIRRMVTDHQVAQDVLQDTFIKAWNGLAQFRGDAKLFSWMYRIAHNECISHLRKLRRVSFASDEEMVEKLTASMDHGEHFSGDEIQRRLQRAVMRLPDKQRAVFQMKYFQELKYEEISAITGTSVGALKSSYHIAVHKVEHWLTNNEGDRSNQNDPRTS